MVFQYDLQKSQSNKIKHGIDFEEAKALWRDVDRLEVPIFRSGEQRFLLVGNIRGVCWTAIITYRDNAVRIISVRRARKEEVLHYEQESHFQ